MGFSNPCPGCLPLPYPLFGQPQCSVLSGQGVAASLFHGEAPGTQCVSFIKEDVLCARPYSGAM